MNVAREVTMNRSKKFIPIKIIPAHGKLVERVRYSGERRKQHAKQQLKTHTTSACLGSRTSLMQGFGMDFARRAMLGIFLKFNLLSVKPTVRAFFAYWDLSAKQHTRRFTVRYRSTRLTLSIR
jgi:hypothetical protein